MASISRLIKARRRPSDFRRSNRLRANLPVAFVTFLPDTPNPHKGVGQLIDISMGGLFFYAPPEALFAMGQSVEVMVGSSESELDEPQTAILKALGKVVRVSQPTDDTPFLGVAVTFIESLDLKE